MAPAAASAVEEAEGGEETVEVPIKREGVEEQVVAIIAMTTMTRKAMPHR